MKATRRPFGYPHSTPGYLEEIEILAAAQCDGPCQRPAVPVACIDNSPDEYPSIHLCFRCLIQLASELPSVDADPS